MEQSRWALWLSGRYWVPSEQQAHVARQQEYKNQTAFQEAAELQLVAGRVQMQGFRISIANTDIGARLSGTTRGCRMQGSWRTMNLQKRLRKPSGYLKRVLGQVWITSLALKRSSVSRARHPGSCCWQQLMYRGLQASAAYQASAQEGKSMDRYVRDVDRQMVTTAP